jgi:SAM-dependent methyltransferase
VQTLDYVTSADVFTPNYHYFSSTSTTWVSHAFSFAEQITKDLELDSNSLVIEIASNDGYLLQHFNKLGVPNFGIEPTKSTAEVAREIGVKTLEEFFNEELARKLSSQGDYADLIIGNNVYAHVPDINDFTLGMKELLKPNGTIVLEFPHLLNMIKENLFDTIYHEHYSYLSAFTVARLGALHGLHLNKVEELAIHGGSNRYWLQRAEFTHVADESVSRVIENEFRIGMFDQQNWHVFSEKVQEILDEFQLWIRKTKDSGGRVYGYGAAAKASTLLNSIDINHGLVVAIADVSLEKQGRFMPPCGIEIISPDDLFSKSPTDVVIFPWNIKSEIAAFLRSNLNRDARLWCAIPEMHEIADL